MHMRDFHPFQSLLSRLTDDPRRGPPDLSRSTSFPFDADEIDGDLEGFESENGYILDRDRPPLSESDGYSDIDAARSSVREAGIDVLAFYKSFRFVDRPPFPGNWGIFILDAGLAGLSAEFQELDPALGSKAATLLASQTLVTHERYHFWIDLWALGQEAAPASSLLTKRYEYYLADKRPNLLTPLDYEERFANLYTLRKIAQNPKFGGRKSATLVKRFFDLCPEPYSLPYFPARASEAAKADSEGLLACAIAAGTSIANTSLLRTARDLEPTGIVFGRSLIPPARGDFVEEAYHCPEHLVATRSYSTVVSPFQGPDLREFRRFMENYLAGEKSSSDHDYYRIDNGEKIKFPNPHDKTVRSYELKGTLLKAGMNLPDFWEARQSTKRWRKHCPRKKAREALIS